MEIKRLIHDLISDPVISGKMILLTGPRQIGKTTAGKAWLAAAGNENNYFNWDEESVRAAFRKDPNFFEAEARKYSGHPRIIFDEIHKIRNWKTILKGWYDALNEHYSFLVIGSARLEFFHRSGDSMFGRYHLLHMSPVTPHELIGNWGRPNTALNFHPDMLSETPLDAEVIDTLIKYSGFPEPLLGASERTTNLWHNEYIQNFVREDIRDLTRISDFNRIEHVIDLLPSRIGSPFSMNAVKEDIGCSFDAIRAIMSAFEKICVITLIRPYHKKIKNALFKEPKIYFYDWTRVKDEGARFENFMAIQLTAFCEFVTDGGWSNLDLHYVRDKQKHEVDFLITANGNPKVLVEAKQNESNLDTNLKFFSERLKNVLAFQVVQKPDIFRKVDDKTWVISANRFFNWLFPHHVQ